MRFECEKIHSLNNVHVFCCLRRRTKMFKGYKKIKMKMKKMQKRKNIYKTKGRLNVYENRNKIKMKML